MKSPLFAITALWAIVSLWLAPAARADVSSSVSSRTTLDTRSGLLTLRSPTCPWPSPTTPPSIIANGRNLVGIIADVNVSLDITHTRAGI